MDLCWKKLAERMEEEVMEGAFKQQKDDYHERSDQQN